MKYTDKYYVIKNNFTGLFWDGLKWIIPKDRLDVYSLAYAATEQEAIDGFIDEVKDLTDDVVCHCVITVIEIETNIKY